MKKVKFRILIYVPIFTFSLLLISVFTLILISPYLNNDESIAVKMASVFSLTIIPLTLFMYTFFTMWPSVEFSGNGIEKTLLGKKQRFISWDDVYEIKRIKTGIAEWLFFSKVSLEGKTIDKCRNRKDNIFIVSTKEIEEVIEHFAPNRLLK
ncbi:MAG: hypothetical protein CVV57_04380 [Tenericutes bacterium HGW-Tenericutes-2]|nr:MAG: hypothetical protein CVV57_04380 [Tenericutes bacterium HGW-Tenericutes-2]